MSTPSRSSPQKRSRLQRRWRADFRSSIGRSVSGRAVDCST
jgi:hypothetical protein